MMRRTSALGVPMTPTQRRDDQLFGPAVRPRARQPYTQVTSTFGPTRSAYEMDMAASQQPAVRSLQLGVPAGGRELGRLDAPPSPAPAAKPSTAASEGSAPADSDAMVSLSKAAPAVASALAQLLADDPRTDVRVYEARVKNVRQWMRTVPGFLRPFLEARLRIVEARLQSAKEHKALEVESERSTRTWRLLGWTSAATGLAIGAGVLALLIAGTGAVSQYRRALP